MFRIAQRGPLKYLESSDPDGGDFLIHAFCTRQGGVSKGHFASLNVSTREGDDADKVHQNFERIASAFGFTAKQFRLVQSGFIRTVSGSLIVPFIVGRRSTAGF